MGAVGGTSGSVPTPPPSLPFPSPASRERGDASAGDAGLAAAARLEKRFLCWAENSRGQEPRGFRSEGSPRPRHRRQLRPVPTGDVPWACGPGGRAACGSGPHGTATGGEALLAA